MDKIMIAYDGSSHSFASIEEVKKLQKGFPHVQIVILHVTDIADLKDQALSLSDDAKVRKYHREQKIKEELADFLNEEEYTIELLYGDPAAEILEYI